MLRSLWKYISVTAYLFIVLAAVPPAYSAACLPPPSGLVSWWRGENNALDSVDGNHGILQNGAGYSTGEAGNGFNLDGINDYLVVNASSNLDVGKGGGLTIEGWINPTTVAYQMPIAEFERALGTFNGADVGVHFYISVPPSGGTGPGCFYANIKGTNGADHQLATGAGLVASNVWQHVALSYDKASGMAVIYLNGAVVLQANIGSFTPQTSYKLLFGARTTFGSASSPSDKFSGKMDELSLYSRALTTAEIQAIYNADGAGKCVPTLPPSCTPPPAGLVSWWKGESNALDSVDGNNGALQGGVTFTAGETGHAFSFNGSNSYVEVPDSPSLRLTNTLTIEFWVKRQQIAGRPYGDIIVEKGGDWTRGVENYGVGFAPAGYGNLFQFFFAGGNRGCGNINDLNWHHCAVVAHNGDVDPTFYLDGVQQPVTWRQGASTINLYPSTKALHIGAQIDPSFIYYSDTLVDELSIYSRALTQSEIHAIYNAGSAGKCVPTLPPSCTPPPSGLVSWWKGESNAVDSVDGNSGVLEGTLGFASGKVGTAFYFSNTNADLKMPAAANLNIGLSNGLTIETWINPSNISLRGPLVEWNNGSGAWGVHLWVSPSSPGELFANIVDSGGGWHPLSAPGVVTSGAFQHVAVTYDKSTGKGTLYRNGVVVAQQTLGAFIPLTTYDLYVGRRVSGAPGDLATFAGLIDETTIYNRALSSNEIASIYLAAAAGKCPSNPPPACTPPPAGQVSWWKAENNGLDSVAGNHGVLEGSIGFAPGEVGQGFSFGDTNADIRIPASASLNVGTNGGFTVEGWINPSDVSQYDHPIVEWNTANSWGVHFYIAPHQFNAGPGALYANVPDSGGGWHQMITAAGVVTANMFQHVALTYDKATGLAVIYRNGVAVLQQNLGSFTPLTTYDLYLGRRPPGGADTYTFAGLLDEVSLYKRALTAAELSAIYNAGSNGKCGGAPLTQGSVSPNLVFGPVIDHGAFVVRFAGIPSLTYTIESAADLNGPWSQAANRTAPTTDTGWGVGVFEFREPIGTSPTRFYRTVYPAY